MSTTQHEAILLADMLGFVQSITPMPKDAARLLRQQHALIVQMAEALEVCRETFRRVQEKTGVTTSAEILAEQILAASNDYLK